MTVALIFMSSIKTTKGKERYLKSRINPSKSENDSGDGHFVSDDAPIKLFM